VQYPERLIADTMSCVEYSLCDSSRKPASRPHVSSNGLSSGLKKVNIAANTASPVQSRRSATSNGPTHARSSTGASGRRSATGKDWKPKWELYQPAKKRIKSRGVPLVELPANMIPRHLGKIRIGLDPAVEETAKRNPRSMAGAFYKVTQDFIRQSAPPTKRR
jgi:hypothetical protein